MKRMITGVLSAAMAVTLLAGCGSSSTPSATASAAPAATTAAQPAAKVKYTLWHSYVGTDQRAGFMEEMMAQYKTKYPNIEVDEQKFPRDQYQTKLKTQAAAGQLPEAFILWPNAMTTEFAKSNLLADINDFLAKNPDWKNSTVSRAIDEFTVDGKTYSVGLGVSLTSIVFYNKALFEKAGVTYPKTYTELKNVINAFNKQKIIPITLGNKPKWPMQSTIFSLVANRMTGTDWLTSALANKGAKFTDAEFVSALDKVKELTDMGAFNKDQVSLDNVQMRDTFYNGQAAMMIDGSWAVPDVIAKASPELKKNIGMDILPKFEDGKGDASVMTGVSSTGIVINKNAKQDQKDAINKLQIFLTDNTAQQLYTKYNIPVSSKTVQIDASKNDPIYMRMVELIKEHPLVTVYDSALNSEQTEVINNGLQSIMTGSAKPADIAKQLAATIK